MLQSHTDVLVGVLDMMRALAVFMLLTIPSVASALPIPVSGLSNGQTGIVKVQQKKKPAAKGSCFSRCAAKGKQMQQCEIACRGQK
jgi:hypothetical protein